MNNVDLINLERQASAEGLLLRIQVQRPLNLWALRLVVAKELEPKKIQILGDMKAWAYSGLKGLQLDTMNVLPNGPVGVGHLIWAATMAWALEETPCRQARLLAIRDDDHQHALLVRYFQRRGFRTTRELGAAPLDLPLRTVWGGAGSLMTADCQEVLKRSCLLWYVSQGIDPYDQFSSA